MRRQIKGIVTVFVLLAAVVGASVALAQFILDFKEMEAIITRIEPTFREVSLWDYHSGSKRSGLQVQGTVDLDHFKVGDYVLARIGVENPLVTYIRVISPPVGDKRFEAALRRVLAESEKGAR